VVLGGHGTGAEAREAFEAFAASRGILAPEALLRSADALGQEWLPASLDNGRRCVGRPTQTAQSFAKDRRQRFG
jgi:hypothetical protein